MTKAPALPGEGGSYVVDKPGGKPKLAERTAPAPSRHEKRRQEARSASGATGKQENHASKTGQKAGEAGSKEGGA